MPLCACLALPHCFPRRGRCQARDIPDVLVLCKESKQGQEVQAMCAFEVLKVTMARAPLRPCRLFAAPYTSPLPVSLQKKAGCTPSSQAGTQLRNKRGRKRQSDAAGLHWCAQQLASSYDGLGGSKDEALAFLERKGVECAVNRGSLRLFRFPGCDRPVGKDRLARALGLQVCKGRWRNHFVWWSQRGCLHRACRWIRVEKQVWLQTRGEALQANRGRILKSGEWACKVCVDTVLSVYSVHFSTQLDHKLRPNKLTKHVSSTRWKAKRGIKNLSKGKLEGDLELWLSAQAAYACNNMTANNCWGAQAALHGILVG
eukprot:1158162-Pelagomonas_calceolata.AAC.3